MDVMFTETETPVSLKTVKSFVGVYFLILKVEWSRSASPSSVVIVRSPKF